MPNVYSYKRRGLTLWAIDVWVKTPTCSKRVREREIPTREQAQARLAKALADAYEGRTFKRAKPSMLTVAKAWTLYEPVAKRNDSWKSDRSRSAHLLAHLGKRIAAELHQGDVDAYRILRQADGTNRKDAKDKPLPPSSATLDREVELLKRVLGYAMKCGKLATNPLAGVALLKVPNVRDVVVSDEDFERIIGALKRRSEWMRPVLLAAYDTGMRIGEVCKLHAKRVDWKVGCVRLTPQETKSEKGRVVALQTRTLAALREMPRKLGCPYLFPARRGYDPRNPRPVSIPRGGLKAALKAVGLEHVHPHDLRRSYATLARRRGIPESVVMAQGGWRTPSVFRRYNIIDEQDVLDAARRMEQARIPDAPAANTQPKRGHGTKKK
jgi:integrase